MIIMVFQWYFNLVNDGQTDRQTDIGTYKVCFADKKGIKCLRNWVSLMPKQKVTEYYYGVDEK